MSTMLTRGFRFSKKRLLLVSITTILIIAVCWLVIKTISGPSEGTINYPENSSQTDAELNNTYVRYDGQKISFSYPEGYRFEKHQDQSPTVLESYFLVAPAKNRNPSFTIGISVYRLPTTDLDENSSYKIRNNSPQTYAKSVKAVGGREVIHFERQNPAERTAFIQNGSLLVAISMTGSLLGEDANSEYKHLIESLQWL